MTTKVTIKHETPGYPSKIKITQIEGTRVSTETIIDSGKEEQFYIWQGHDLKLEEIFE